MSSPYFDDDDEQYLSDHLFEDNEPGSYNKDSGTWQKPQPETPANQIERKVYEAITPHPRIVAFYGVEDYNYLSLQYHPNGDLWSYLVNKRPSLATRIDWAVEIAEGLAHLHSKNVYSVHVYFTPLTNDLHVVLADFGYSVMNASLRHTFTTCPPPVFACPDGYYGRPPKHVDLFGFGVMLFALLVNRFPWTQNLTPGDDEQQKSYHTHAKRQFDTIDDPQLNELFGPILDRCFDYDEGKKDDTEGYLLNPMKQARDKWLSLDQLPFVHLT
ncbi:kinase-like domain-containing protein [Mycena crocata]|nr:kinase-like domain-containing protein [Mycena crocata]